MAGSRRLIAPKIPSSAARSASITCAIPGYWILTAPWRPSARRARCTWAMEAEATGSGSNSLNASLMGHPISRATAPSITVHGCGGTRSCSSERLSMYGAGRRSGRDEANWAALIKVPPSAAAASSTRPAPRRCCSSQSSSSTRPGINRARAQRGVPDPQVHRHDPEHEHPRRRGGGGQLGEARREARRRPAACGGSPFQVLYRREVGRRPEERLGAYQISIAGQGSHVRRPSRGSKRVSSLLDGAPRGPGQPLRRTRASSPHTRAASARRGLAANTVGQAPSQLRDRFFAASAYNWLSPSGSISSSLQRKQTNHRATAWPLILRRDRERNRR